MADLSEQGVNGTGDDARAAKQTVLRQKVQSLRLPTHVHAGSSANSRLPWLLSGILAVSTLAFGTLYLLEKQTAHPLQAAPAATTGAGADSASGPVADVGDAVLESKGYVIPVHQIQVSPLVGGRLVDLNVLEGMRVKEGAILAQIETIDYQADVNRLRGQYDGAWQRWFELVNGSRPEEIKQAQAELEEADANRRQMLLDWERNQKLRGDALSRKDFELAESGFKAADKRLEQKRQMYRLMVEGPRQEKIDAAFADMDVILADLVKAEWRLDNCTVRSPISGTILTKGKSLEKGSTVNPVAFSNGVAASLCDMADLSDLEIELKIQERDIAKVRTNQPCKVRSEAYPDRVYDGFVSRLMPIADRSQAALPVRVKVMVPEAEQGLYLRPEMGVVVSFLKK